jgi:hypothetical protein
MKCIFNGMTDLKGVRCFLFLREKTEEYTRLIKARDSAAIMKLLTDVAVEERVIQRVTLKAATFGQDIGVGGVQINGKKVLKATFEMMLSVTSACLSNLQT